jgi:hypothetical protein
MEALSSAATTRSCIAPAASSVGNTSAHSGTHAATNSAAATGVSIDAPSAMKARRQALAAPSSHA